MTSVPTSGSAPSLVAPTLGSLWDGLSPHLIASFWPVRRVNWDVPRYWRKIEDQPTITAPLMEANIEMVLGWKSPFEDAGTDKGMPTISAMMQSGAITAWTGPDKGEDGTFAKFEGRTGITKLNSTQVFAGMPPIKITATALFRAWRDPISEVMVPVTKLIEWALPQSLAPDGPLLSLLQEIKEAAGGKDIREAAAAGLLPSKAPMPIGMKYKGVLYQPMVIESIGYPIFSPVDANGNHVELAVPLTLCSLAAIDRDDWSRATRGVQGFTV